jgi:flagellar basal-body rod modification protein FlgD
MSNMNSELGKVLNLLAKSQAVALLGKTVEILEGNQSVIGTVQEVAGGEYPQILVNGKYYDVANVERVSKELGE